VVAFPLMYKTAQGAFEQIDANLLQAEPLGRRKQRYSGGSSSTAGVARIAGTVLAFARALGESGATLMLAGNIPGQTQTIPVAIYFAVGGRYEASLDSGNLGYFFDGSHHRELWSDSRRSVAVDRGGEEQGKQELGILSGDKGRWENLTPKRRKGLFVDIQKQLPGFSLETFFITELTPRTVSFWCR